MVEIMKTKKDLIGCKEASANLRTNHNVGSKLGQPKGLSKIFRVDKTLR